MQIAEHMEKLLPVTWDMHYQSTPLANSFIHLLPQKDII